MSLVSGEYSLLRHLGPMATKTLNSKGENENGKQKTEINEGKGKVNKPNITRTLFNELCLTTCRNMIFLSKEILNVSIAE